MKALIRRLTERKKNESTLVSLDESSLHSSTTSLDSTAISGSHASVWNTDVKALQNGGFWSKLMKNDTQGKRGSSQSISGGQHSLMRSTSPAELSRSYSHGFNSLTFPTSPTGGPLSSRFSFSLPFLVDDTLPMSPADSLTSLSQIDERNELISLNDKMAVLLWRNFQMETENTFLSTQIKDANSKLTLITSELSRAFEKQHKRQRALRTNILNKKTKVEKAVERLQVAVDDVADKVHQQSEKITVLTEKVKTLNPEIVNLTLDLSRRENELRNLTQEKKNMQQRLTKSRVELASTLQIYEMEEKQKTGLEVELKRAKEKIEMEMRIHQEQIVDLADIRIEETKHVKSELESKIDVVLQDTLGQLRLDCEMYLDNYRVELSTLYATKEADLIKEMDRRWIWLELQYAEVQRIIGNFEKQVSRITENKTNLEDQIKCIREEWSLEKAEWIEEQSRLDGIINELEAERLNLLGEYQGLMELTVGLESEISNYECLLESEEERLSHSLEQIRSLVETDILPGVDIKGLPLLGNVN